MSEDFSKAAMLKYLEDVTRQGAMNANTAGGLRAAAVKLLEDLASTDDVRKVDVEAMAIRYHNKHPGDLSTDSLVIYKQRLTRLIADFKQWVVNPLEFKPKARVFTAKNADKANGRSPKKPDIQREETTVSLQPTPAPVEAAATRTLLSLPYPLRPDFEARIVVPRDITSEEARRLCAFIATLAADFRPAS